MAILSKGHTFADGDQVTSTKLNNLVDLSTFAAGAVDGVTMLLDGAGYVKVGVIQTGNIAASAVTTAKIADSTGTTDGITTAKLATSAVTTAKITDSAVTTAKIADASITTAKMAAGSGTFPIKVQQVVKSDTQTVTGGSWTDIASLSLAFTRTHATSKIRVQAVVCVTTNNYTYGSSIRVVRGSTEVGVPSTSGSRTLASASSDHSSILQPTAICVDFIDDVSAVATNPLTYKIQAYIFTGITGYINRSTQDNDAAGNVRTISTMTLTELA